MKIDLPYLTCDRGRLYVRARKWPRKIRLREKPGTDPFLDEYRNAITQLEREAAPSNAVAPGSFWWLCRQYYNSSEYKELAGRTRHVRRQILEREFATVGDRPYRQLQAKHIRRMRDAAHDRGPEAANNLLKALRSIFKWAVDVGLVERNPARDVRLVKSRSGGLSHLDRR